jgi:DNA polymerase delta subunit 2
MELIIIPDTGEETRIIMVPSFVQTGQIVLVCLETLECKTVGFEVPLWAGDAVEENGEAMEEE